MPRVKKSEISLEAQPETALVDESVLTEPMTYWNVLSSGDRRCTITISGPDKPYIKFDGTWTGRDIRTVFATLRRAYYQNQLSVRRTVA